jgi:biopolymer transport protein ExbB
VVEGARLESVYTPKVYRGFESLPLCINIYYLKLHFFYIFKPLNKLKEIKMKRLLSILTVLSFFMITSLNAKTSVLQDEELQEVTETVVDSTEAEETTAPDVADETPAPEVVEEVQKSIGFHQELKNRFIEGGPGFMGIVLLCLILGLAIAIERIIYLSLATSNSDKLISDVESSLKSGGLDAAKEVCRNTPGPVASIFYQGLDRANEDLESAEKAVVAYGGVQMGQLEKNVSWISLFIALAPMLGFMGTVIGMIQAFDKIEAAGDMQPSLVAGGIKVALLTTVFGLIVAIILQIFYNYIISQIDSIVNDMENASISLMDILVKNKK